MTKPYQKPERFGPLRRVYLKEWREAVGLSQAELARRMGTSKTTLSNAEAGTSLTGISQALLEAAAHVLGCEPWDLLMHPPSDAQFDREWMTEIGALRRDERQQAIGHIRLIRTARRS